VLKLYEEPSRCVRNYPSLVVRREEAAKDAFVYGKDWHVLNVWVVVD